MRYSIKQLTKNNIHLIIIYDNKENRNVFATSNSHKTAPWAIKQLVDRLNKEESCGN